MNSKNHPAALFLMMFMFTLGSIQHVHANSENANILAAYALYAQNTDTGITLSLARVVVEGANQGCPALSAVKDMQARHNPDPVNFPVTVCEGIYSSSKAVSIPGASFDLPAIKSAPENIFLFGDTGYKSKQLKDNSWIFPELAKKASKKSPDVVLHMGDYNYSGTPGHIKVNGDSVQVYDAGDNTTQGLCKIPGGYYGQNSHGSENPDTWAAWKSNFFDAAQDLLSAAPFVFSRGNHELCSRAGTGWFYLLDSNSPLLGKYATQLSCPAADNNSPMVLSSPFLINLDELNLLVLDSTNACDSGRLNTDDYINQFAFMNQLASNAPESKQTWLVSHRPFWGVDKLADVGACGSDSKNKYCYVTQTLQAADNATHLSKALDMVVSGHMHRFQVVSFKSPSHAQQLIVGNGGVELAKMHPKKTTTMEIDGDTATVMGIDDFGYMSIKLDKSKWTGKLFGQKKSPLLECQSDQYPMCSK